MATYKDKLERQELYNDAVSTAVNAEQLNRGARALDEGFFAADNALGYIKRQNAIKSQLVELLRKGKQYGLTDSDKAEILRLQLELKECKAPESHYIDRIETQDIPVSYGQMIADDMQMAKEYNIDLSDPFLSAFSNIDKAVISAELTEDFDLLRLDKYDYAFAAFAGLMGGLVDALFVGTITNKSDERGKLLELTDNAYDKIVEKYARMSGWTGPKINDDGTSSNSTKSAIGYLERNFKVNYDQGNRNDFKKLGIDLENNELNGFATKNHHLRGMAHSFSPLGLVIGILDALLGITTVYDPNLRKLMSYETGKPEGVNGIYSAICRWFGHCMSDVAGSSGANGRGTGLPAPFMEIFQQMQFGKIPMGKTVNTIGSATEELFKQGLDLRAFTAMSIPVIATELMVRIYWFLKQHFYYGKSIKESIPFGKSREMQRLLLISSLSFSTIDVAHGIVKGEKSDLVTMLLTINYVGLVNFGYKLYMNFRLEHQHNKQLKEHMQNDVRQKFNLLLED